MNTTSTAEIEILCRSLDDNLTFFTEQYDFHINSIFPADSPISARINGYGLRLHLKKAPEDHPITICLISDDPKFSIPENQQTAPNGSSMKVTIDNPPLQIPEEKQSLVITRLNKDVKWGVGRAGMQYRDLIPDRQGGRYIASHIRIPGAGPVPDYVHHHNIRFQMIFCLKGSVKVAYEDQGEPMLMKEGDCFLQPSNIRHRVLERYEEGLEVIEIGCPAEHMTSVDHEMTLPTGLHHPERDFSGQRFVFHQQEKGIWQPYIPGFEGQDYGIGTATDGLAGVRVLRRNEQEIKERSHSGEFFFHFIIKGSMKITIEGSGEHTFGAHDCYIIPRDTIFQIATPSTDLEILEVTLPHEEVK